MSYDNGNPIDNSSADRERQEVHENFSREEIGHSDDEQGKARAKAERVDWYAPGRQLPEPLRGMTFFCQSIGDAGIAVNCRVIDGNGRRQDNEIEEIRRSRKAHIGENLDERAVLRANLIPRPEAHDDDHRTDVEDENAPDNLIDCLGQGAFGIFCFSCGDTD